MSIRTILENMVITENILIIVIYIHKLQIKYVTMPDPFVCLYELIE